jgi:hypothetical protein
MTLTLVKVYFKFIFKTTLEIDILIGGGMSLQHLVAAWRELPSKAAVVCLA